MKNFTDEKWHIEITKNIINGASDYPELPVKEILKQLFFKVIRKTFSNESIRQKYYDTRPVINSYLTGLLDHLSQIKAQGIHATAILSPHPMDPTLSKSDGYMRRVSAIDNALFSNQCRVYLHDSPYWKVDEIKFEYMDAGNYYVVYNSR